MPVLASLVVNIGNKTNHQTQLANVILVFGIIKKNLKIKNLFYINTV